jgi:predicted nuclease of predicted toxin-antitoxin system
MSDVDDLKMAADDGRVVVTSDKDFGELVFVHRLAYPGVILIRIALADESDRVSYLRSVWPAVMSRLPGFFVTVSVGSVRARPIV